MRSNNNLLIKRGRLNKQSPLVDKGLIRTINSLKRELASLKEDFLLYKKTPQHAIKNLATPKKRLLEADIKRLKPLIKPLKPKTQPPAALKTPRKLVRDSTNTQSIKTENQGLVIKTESPVNQELKNNKATLIFLSSMFILGLLILVVLVLKLDYQPDIQQTVEIAEETANKTVKPPTYSGPKTFTKITPKDLSITALFILLATLVWDLKNLIQIAITPFWEAFVSVFSKLCANTLKGWAKIISTTGTGLHSLGKLAWNITSKFWQTITGIVLYTFAECRRIVFGPPPTSKELPAPSTPSGIASTSNNGSETLENPSPRREELPGPSERPEVFSSGPVAERSTASSIDRWVATDDAEGLENPSPSPRQEQIFDELNIQEPMNRDSVENTVERELGNIEANPQNQEAAELANQATEEAVVDYDVVELYLPLLPEGSALNIYLQTEEPVDRSSFQNAVERGLGNNEANLQNLEAAELGNLTIEGIRCAVDLVSPELGAVLEQNPTPSNVTIDQLFLSESETLNAKSPAALNPSPEGLNPPLSLEEPTTKALAESKKQLDTLPKTDNPIDSRAQTSTSQATPESKPFTFGHSNPWEDCIAGGEDLSFSEQEKESAAVKAARKLARLANK